MIIYLFFPSLVWFSIPSVGHTFHPSTTSVYRRIPPTRDERLLLDAIFFPRHLAQVLFVFLLQARNLIPCDLYILHPQELIGVEPLGPPGGNEREGGKGGEGRGGEGEWCILNYRTLTYLIIEYRVITIIYPKDHAIDWPKHPKPSNRAISNEIIRLSTFIQYRITYFSFFVSPIVELSKLSKLKSSIELSYLSNLRHYFLRIYWIYLT